MACALTIEFSKIVFYRTLSGPDSLRTRYPAFGVYSVGVAAQPSHAVLVAVKSVCVACVTRSESLAIRLSCPGGGWNPAPVALGGTRQTLATCQDPVYTIVTGVT